MARDKVEFDVIGRDVSGSKTFRDVGDAAEKAGDKADGAGKDFRGLDAEIKATRESMKALAAEIDRTGNKDLFKDLRQQRAELRRLTQTRDLLDGDQVAQGFAAKFSQRVGPLLAQAPVSPPLMAAFGGAAAAVSPIVAGAVTAGVAAAGVGTGLAIAFKDPEVQAAGKGLGAELGASLKDAAKPFVPETLKSIGIVRAEFRALKPEVDGLFRDAAQYVEPLTYAATGFVRDLTPGLREATRNAEPLVEVLGEHGPKAGAAFGSALRSLSQDAGYTAASLDGLLTGVEQSLAATGKMIEWANKAGPYLGGALLPWLGSLGESEDKAKVAAESTEDLGSKVQDAGGKANVAAAQVETWTAAIARMAGDNINAEQANIRLEAAIDRATDAAKRNGDGIDVNKPKQRDNYQALLDIARAANDSAAAILTQTGSQDLASGATERGRAAFMKAAEAMGVGRDKAKELADKLFAIPGSRNVTVTANTQPALDAVNSLIRRINNMKARINVYAESGTSFGGGAHTGFGYSTGYSEGGLHVGPGTGTSDDIVARVSTGEYTLRAAAVRAIGVDTLDALNQADRRPVTVAAGSGGGRAPVATSGLDDERFVRLWRRAMSGMTLLLDDRTGRTATLLARGA